MSLGLRFAGRSLLWLNLVFIASAAYGADDMRTWSDASGKHKIKAKLEAVEDGKAILLRDTGKKMTIDVAKLSKADQDYIAEHASDSPFQDAEETPFESAEQESRPAAGGSRTVKVNWSFSRDLSLLPSESEWKVDVAAEVPANFPAKAVALPAKTDFFEGLNGMAVSRNGKSAVVGYGLNRPGRNDKASVRLVLCNLQDGRVFASASVEGEMLPLALADDGKRILMRRNEFGHGKGDRLEIWTIKGKSVARSLVWTPFTDSWGPSNDVSWAEFLDGDKLALCSSGGKLAIWDLANGQPICHFQTCSGAKPALSADRKWIAFANEDTLGLLDVQKQEVVASVATPRKLTSPSLAFSPSGKRIGCTAHDRILVWNSSTGELEKDFQLTGLHLDGRIVFPDEGFLLVGDDYLIELDNQLKLWHYEGAEKSLAFGGSVLFAVPGDQKSGGALMAAKVPHAEALTMLKKALAQSDLFAFRKGMPVKLDVAGISDPTEQNNVRESLTKKLADMNCTVEQDGKVEVVAYVEGPNSRTIEYWHAGTFQVQEYLTKLKFVYQGKAIWETQNSNIPGGMSLKEGENVATKLQEASQKPNYKFYEWVTLPEFLQKPLDGQNNGQPGAGQTIGQSHVTPRGIR
jgi:WD40 repeat protein